MRKKKNIVVMGGSPKGETSVTMQYVKYIQKEFPQHEFRIFQVAQPIHVLEKNGAKFDEIISNVKSCDGVLWAFPLYVFLVCSQYKRFIELISVRHVKEAFQNKYAASLSTSIHFFDHTAHNYMHAICDDLDMKFFGSFSAGMRDLLKTQGQKNVKIFARSFLDSIEKKIEAVKVHQPIRWDSFAYLPSDTTSSKLHTSKKIVILTDSLEGNVGMMITHFSDLFSHGVEVINLNEVDIKGGCLGCLRCGKSNVCAYTGKDGFIDMYNGKLKTADVLVYAGAIKDRFLSSKWKQFLDRSFFNTHQRSLEGKQFGFLISGPLSQVANLREILNAYVEWQNSNLVDIITDESHNPSHIDRAIEGMAERLVQFADEGYIRPATFLGIGGMKIFRDDIWGSLRVVFKADHRAYKKSGIYDFPQKRLLRNIFVRILWLVTGIPWIYKKMMNNFKKFMIMPYRRVLKDG
jgi:multimeric flavodoxin WrbA